MFDPKVFKSQFPLFDETENRRLVYLDNAATTQRPRPVIDAITRFYTTANANTHRSSHRLARRATDMVEQTRAKAAAFVGAASSADIVFTRGATEALNLLAHTLGQGLQPGDEIVLSTAEHHANLVPWQMQAQQRGLQLRFLPETQGIPHFERLVDCLSDRTRIVSLTAGSNALGFTSDTDLINTQLRQWRQAHPQQQIALILDAAQLAAHQVIDVQALGCDYLVCSAHKFYGPTGIGLLYGRAELLRQLPPWLGGGEMIEHVELETSTYAAPPHRFESGTSALASIAGLAAAIDFLTAQDRVAMAAYEQGLVKYLHTQLSPLRGLQLLTAADNNLGIAAFVPEAASGLTAVDLAHLLDERDIAVRIGHHCAQPLMKSLDAEATVRASIAAYNTREDIDALVNALNAILNGCGFVQQPAASTAGGDAEVCAGDDLSGLSLSQLRQLKGWQPRYRALMKWGDRILPKPAIRTDANRVRGCESAAWLEHRIEQGKHVYAIDSDSRVVKGLAVLLLVLINDKTAEEIAAVPLEQIFVELGLEKHLSQSRSNGFRALLDRMLASTFS